MNSTTVADCMVCGSSHIRSHCERRVCGWWKCRKCGAYGNGARYVDARPKGLR